MNFDNNAAMKCCNGFRGLKGVSDVVFWSGNPARIKNDGVKQGKT